MKFFGYGEDALTLWALTNKITREEFIKKIKEKTPDDKTDINAFTIFYRPSFGRGKNLGEFDFIIVSDTFIYLGESKWNNSSCLGKECIKLDDAQIERHKIFEALFNPRKKSELSANHKISQKIGYIEKVKETSKLSENIKNFKTVAGIINKNKEFKNILLFFYAEEKNYDNLKCQNSDFSIIPIKYPKYNEERTTDDKKNKSTFLDLQYLMEK